MMLANIYSLLGILLFVSLVESIEMANFHKHDADYERQNEKGQEYFYITGEGNYGDYMNLVDEMIENNYTNMSLLTDYDCFEYSLGQYLLKEGFNLNHVGVTNMTVKLDSDTTVATFC